MSYCRWSSDDFGCDVYAYESAEGFTVHVAVSRYTGDIPKLPPMPFNQGDEKWAKWFKAYHEQQAAVAVSPQADIGGEYDGKTFVYADLQAFYDGLLDIRTKGYHVPDYVFDCIQEEIKEQK